MDFLQSDDEEKESRLCANPTMARALLVLVIVAVTFCGVFSLWWMGQWP